MALSILITLLTLPPILLFLILLFSTSAYMSQPPGGPDAMALFLPMALTVLAGLMMLLATWLCAARGGFDFVSTRPIVPTLVTTLVTLGVALGGIGIFFAWVDRGHDWVPKLGWLAGGLAPIGLCALLLACAWIPTDSARQSTVLRLIYLPLVLWAIVGLTSAAVVGGKVMRQRSIKIQNQIAQAQAEEVEWERKQNRTPLEAVREDYGTMHADSPLWSIAAGLPDYTNAECRTFIIERAFQVPDFETQLASTIASGHPRYRHGCLDIVRFAQSDRRKPEWPAYVVHSIDVSVEEIKSDPHWMIADEGSNPNPIEHVRAMVQAAKAVGNSPEVQGAIQRLREAIEGLPDEPTRVEAKKALNPDQ